MTSQLLGSLRALQPVISYHCQAKCATIANRDIRGSVTIQVKTLARGQIVIGTHGATAPFRKSGMIISDAIALRATGHPWRVKRYIDWPTGESATNNISRQAAPRYWTTAPWRQSVCITGVLASGEFL